MRLYGGERIDHFHSHIRTGDGGWAFAGRTHRDLNWFVKTTDDGEMQLMEAYNIDDGRGAAWDLCQTEDGGYLLAGSINVNGHYDASAIRIDQFGDEIWGRLYGDRRHDYFRAVEHVSGDRYILAGNSYSFVDSLDNGMIIVNGGAGYLCFINGNNEVIWQGVYGGLETDALEDVIVVEGGFVAAGRSRSFNGENNDLWLLRVDEEGEEVWSFGYGDEASELGFSVIRTDEDNGFAIGGYEMVEDPDNEDEYLFHPIILKLDENGDEVWFNRYLVNDLSKIIYDLARTPDNGYILVGYSFENPRDWQEDFAYIMCADVDGNFMWERSDALENVQAPNYNSVVLAEDNGITSAGRAYFENVNGHLQGLFSKYSPANLPPVIFDYNPEDSVLFLLQNDDQAFSVDARDPEGADLIYQWTLNEQIVGDEEVIILEFPELGDFRLTVEVSDGVHSRFVSWQIHIFRLISGYSPLDSALTVVQDTTVQFFVQPGIEDDTIAFLFTLDEDSIGNSPFASLQFDELGEFIVQANVMTRGCCDSVVWHLTVVEPNSVQNFSEQFQPTYPVLYPPSPNPFNSTIRFSMYLPREDNVSLSIYDINGREVSKLINGETRSGNHSVVWNANNNSTGVFVVVMKFNHGVTKRKKIVLVK